MNETVPIALTEADYVQAQRLHFRRYYRTRRPRVALAGSVVAWAAFVWLTWDAPAPAPIAAVFHLGVFTILLLPVANIPILNPLPDPDEEPGGSARDPIALFQRHQRALSRWRAGDVLGARADLDAVIALDPGNAAPRLDRGRLNRWEGRLDAAVADFDAALTLDPEDGPYHTHRAEAHVAAGAFDAALADFEAALALDPRDVTALCGRSDLLAQRDEATALAGYAAALVQRSRRQLRVARRLTTTSTDPRSSPMEPGR